MSEVATRNEPTIYHTGGGWGDAINWLNYSTRRVVGWKSRKPMPGDKLRSVLENGREAEFTFLTVEDARHVSDMFFATVSEGAYVDQWVDEE